MRRERSLIIFRKKKKINIEQARTTKTTIPMTKDNTTRGEIEQPLDVMMGNDHALTMKIIPPMPCHYQDGLGWEHVPIVMETVRDDRFASQQQQQEQGEYDNDDEDNFDLISLDHGDEGSSSSATHRSLFVIEPPPTVAASDWGDFPIVQRMRNDETMRSSHKRRTLSDDITAVTDVLSTSELESLEQGGEADEDEDIVNDTTCPMEVL